MGKSFFTGTDHALFTGAENFAIKIAKNPQQLGLTPEQVTSFTDASNIYGTAYQAAVDPETRTKGKVAAKNAAKKALKIVASDLAKIIDGTPTHCAGPRIGRRHVRVDLCAPRSQGRDGIHGK